MRAHRWRWAGLLLASVAVWLGGGANGAKADTITETVAFTGTGFGSGAPFSTVSGRVTLSFDPAVDQIGTPLPSFTSNLPASYLPFVFNFNATNQQVTIGDSCVGFICSVQTELDQAVLGFFVDGTGAPIGSRLVLGYTAVGSPTNFVASSVTVSLVTGTAVAEPASLLVLAAGTIGLVAVRRRRTQG